MRICDTEMIATVDRDNPLINSNIVAVPRKLEAYEKKEAARPSDVAGTITLLKTNWFDGHKARISYVSRKKMQTATLGGVRETSGKPLRGKKLAGKL